MSDNYKTNIPASLEIERRVLAGLLIHAEKVWPEIEGIISVKDFYQEHKHNSIVFTIIKGFCDEGKSLEPALIAEKIKNLGIRFDEIEPLAYIESLKQIEITELGLKEAVKELLRISVRRALYLSCRKQAQFIVGRGSNLSIDEIITETDKIHVEVLKEYTGGKNEPKNLFSNVEETINRYAKENRELPGLKTHLSDFNNTYGGICLKESYGFIARPETGKSNFLDDLALNIGNLINQESIINSKHIPILKLDTEMTFENIELRLISRLANIMPVDIQTGRFNKNREMSERMKKAIETMKNYSYDHVYCPSISTLEMLNIAKRWIFKKVGRGNPCMILLDYLKLGGRDNLNESNRETVIIGQKLEMWNDFIKENCAAFCFGGQANREGIQKDKSGPNQTDAIFADSDRIQRYASYTAILRKNTLEELAKFPIEKFGTHRLITAKQGRVGGFQSKGHLNYVKIGGKFEKNFICLDIHNLGVFEVRDMGDAESVKRYVEGHALLDRHETKQSNNIEI